MNMKKYEIGRVVFGNAARIAAALERFERQEVDEVRFAPDRASPFPGRRRTIAREVSVAGIGTFKGSEKQTLTFAPESRPGWWIRRMDLPE
jgi:hypothetical protein